MLGLYTSQKIFFVFCMFRISHPFCPSICLPIFSLPFLSLLTFLAPLILSFFPLILASPLFRRSTHATASGFGRVTNTICTSSLLYALWKLVFVPFYRQRNIHFSRCCHFRSSFAVFTSLCFQFLFSFCHYHASFSLMAQLLSPRWFQCKHFLLRI